MNYDYNANIDLLERYIEGNVTEGEKIYAEQLLNDNTDLQEEYEYMKLAVTSVQLSVLHKQVGNIAQAYITTKQNAIPSSTTKVRSIGFYTLRVAAVFVAVVASYTAIQYATITTDKLYASSFENYNLSVTRGITKGANVDQLYKMENWEAVLAMTSEENNQKEKFLGGVAALQLNKPAISVDYFQQIINSNNKQKEQSFTQESEFYLALAFIKLNELDEAKKIINKIKENPSHIYFNQAKKISTFKTALLSFKHK